MNQEKLEGLKAKLNNHYSLLRDKQNYIDEQYDVIHAAKGEISYTESDINKLKIDIKQTEIDYMNSQILEEILIIGEPTFIYPIKDDVLDKLN